MESISARFDRLVIKHPDDQCWEWSGYVSKKGYGYFWLGGKWMGAHIASYIIHSHSIIPNGKQVLHRCDNKVCTNPKHLYLGTPSNNICDRYERPTKEFAHKPYKISSMEMVSELIKLYRSSKYSYEDLSKKFNLPKTTIFRTIKRNQSL